MRELAPVTWSNEESQPNRESPDSNEEPSTIKTAPQATPQTPTKPFPKIEIDCPKPDAFAYLLPKSIILEESQELSSLPPDIISRGLNPIPSDTEHSLKRTPASPRFQDVSDDYIIILGVDTNNLNGKIFCQQTFAFLYRKKY